LTLSVDFTARAVGVLTILLFTLGSAISIWLFEYFCRKIGILNFRTKWIGLVVLTFLIYLYLYLDYSSKIIHNRITHAELRSEIFFKIEHPKTMALGFKADSLTYLEYSEITSSKWLLEVPRESSNISISFSYDGFLPDFQYDLSYDIPLNVEVETFEENYAESFRNQSVEKFENKQRIIFQSGAQ
jgi:hypothetical protein